MKIWFQRARVRKSLKASHASRLCQLGAVMTEDLYKLRELIVQKTLQSYDLDPEDKLLWYKLLCIADWPSHMDRTHELQEFRRKRIRRKRKASDLKEHLTPPKGKRRRVIRD